MKSLLTLRASYVNMTAKTMAATIINWTSLGAKQFHAFSSSPVAEPEARTWQVIPGSSKGGKPIPVGEWVDWCQSSWGRAECLTLPRALNPRLFGSSSDTEAGCLRWEVKNRPPQLPGNAEGMRGGALHAPICLVRSVLAFPIIYTRGN